MSAVFPPAIIKAEGNTDSLFQQVEALNDACLENLGVFLGHCHVGMGEHLAHCLDTHALCQGPGREGVAPDVKGEYWNWRKKGDEDKT